MKIAIQSRSTTRNSNWQPRRAPRLARADIVLQAARQAPPAAPQRRMSPRPVAQFAPGPDNVCHPRDDDDIDPVYLRKISAAPRVLHVDRDAGAALALTTLLMPEVQVTHAESLSAALNALRREAFALVVLDPDLPDGDGAALLPLLKDIPVLLYSSRQPEWTRKTAAFLVKPWTSHRQLWVTVASILGIDPGMSGGGAA